MKLSVVIVNYNVKYYLEQCLHSLYRACGGIDAEIWVVDNASSDGSLSYLRSRFPQVCFIENKENVGFSRANNQAICRSTGEYVLLLNPDTIVGENVLAACVDFLDEHTEVGATGVAMLKEDGGFAWESRRGLPTPFTSFCKMSGLCALFPHSRTFGRYYMRYLDKEKANAIEVISGAFNMIRRSALDKTGLLDEDFFMYGEDIDLSYRLLQQGYKNYYLPVRILHYKGESTQKSSFRHVHVFYKAMLIFFDKHYRRSHRWLAPFIQLAVVVRGFFDLCLKQKTQLSRLVEKRLKKDADKKKKRYLVLGKRETLDAVRALCEENQLHATFVEADEQTHPLGHWEYASLWHECTYVVYDTSAYRYEAVLNLLYQSKGGVKCKLKIATYSPQTHKLITLSEVL